MEEQSNSSPADKDFKSLLAEAQISTSIAKMSLIKMTSQQDLEPDADSVKMLSEEFPVTSIQTIKEKLRKSNMSVDKARISLKNSGHKERNAPSPSPFRQSQTGTTSTSAALRSNGEDNKSILQKRFPSLDPTVILLSLRVAHNDINMATKVLQAKEDKNRNVNISTETATTNFQDKAKETTFAPTQINSVSEKRRVLKQRFPLFDDIVINMSLKVTNDDLEMATKILEAKKLEDKKKEVPESENKYKYVFKQMRNQSTAKRSPLSRQDNVDKPKEVKSFETLSYKMNGQKSSSTKQTTSRDGEKKVTKQLQNSKNLVNLSNEEKLRREFPSLDSTTIALCLKVTKNDFDIAKKILKSKVMENEKKMKKSESEKALNNQKNDQTNITFPASSTSANHATTKTTTKADRTKSTVQKTRTTPKQKTANVKKRSPIPRKIIDRSTYTSTLRTVPIGSNPSLTKGPDSSLLLTVRTPVAGPNKAYCIGPQKENYRGPDPSNRVGSAKLAVGPMVAVNV